MLDKAVCGHQHAKQKILQLASQWVTNPSAMTQCLGIVGPPGNGKTTLVRDGVARALGRPFVQISLGGAKDSSTLEGHNFTYVGSTYGRIVAALMEAQVMNPIIFFDELDKVSENASGNEIIGVLTHLTDPTQNKEFRDQYFSGLPFDLSKVMFVFSFNNEVSINNILKDRLTIVRVRGFSHEEKVQMAQTHLIPRILRNLGLPTDSVNVTSEAIKYLLCRLPAQEGVRGLLKGLESALMQFNYLRLTEGHDNNDTQNAYGATPSSTPARDTSVTPDDFHLLDSPQLISTEDDIVDDNDDETHETRVEESPLHKDSTTSEPKRAANKEAVASGVASDEIDEDWLTELALPFELTAAWMETLYVAPPEEHSNAHMMYI
eukprot:Selendium_serpulae@DN4825_c0_g1_i1.p1